MKIEIPEDRAELLRDWLESERDATQPTGLFWRGVVIALLWDIREALRR